MNTLRVRLLAAFAYVLVLVLVALAVPFAVSLSSRVDAEVRAQTAAEAHLIAAAVAGRLDRPGALQELVARAADDVRGRVVVVDAAGTLVADSEGTHLLGSDYGARPELAVALEEGRVAQGRRSSDTLGEDLLYTAVPVVDGERRVGAVRVTRSAAPLDARVRRDVLVLLGIALAALALGLALAWLLAGSLARPLRGLAATARRVGGGDLSARAELAGSAEQREVATAFNDMTARVARVLDAQREFVANASHQLRTPLTGLRLRLEAAALKAPDPDLERELAAAEREVERLAKLLTALLTLAREGGDAGAARPVDVASAAAAAAERWRPEVEQGGRRLVLRGDEGVAVRASEEDVAIVLDNLVENALLYSPAGSTVTIEWSDRGDAVALAVLDEGLGVAGDDAERLFARFERGTAGSSSPGTGLGLAIVRTLAQRWGGDATLTDRPGGGARAEVTLPAAPRPAGVRELEAQRA
ncbi:MAG TPA: HAMP domain-containing sensor histidine kinase [Gaiellaceae bacterium]|nr:HAMP domain-containing sensor histidine kinase [Gaiellaceae bacterium]